MQYNFHPGAATVGTFTPDNLIADGHQATKAVQLKSGALHKRGTVLMETATAGVYDVVTADAKAVYVLLEDRDLSAEASTKPGMVAMTGAFNKPALIIGAGATVAGVTKALEAVNIYVRDSVAVQVVQ